MGIYLSENQAYFYSLFTGYNIYKPYVSLDPKYLTLWWYSAKLPLHLLFVHCQVWLSVRESIRFIDDAWAYKECAVY